jgi:hypothetical protein
MRVISSRAIDNALISTILGSQELPASLTSHNYSEKPISLQRPAILEKKQPGAKARKPITAKPKFSGFIVALVGFCFVNVCALAVVNHQAKQFGSNGLNQQRRMFGRVGSWWLARAYLQQEPPPTIFIFGSSQMGGLQCADARVTGRNIDFTLDHESFALEQELAKRLHTKVTVFNGAIPGAMISDHIVISRALFSAGTKPKIAIIGFSPRDFIDNTCPSPTSTESFMFFSKFADLNRQLPLFFSNGLEQLQWQLSQCLPLRNNVQSLLSGDQSTAQHIARKPTTAQSAMMYKPFEPIEPGQCTIGTNPPKIFVDNISDYSNRYKNCFNGSLKQQLQCFRVFCSQMKSNNVQVIAVGMPLLPPNRNLLPPSFWHYFLSQVQTISSETGAKWINFTDDPSFKPDDYFDTVHLNTQGGLKFASKLADTIAQDRALPSLP